MKFLTGGSIRIVVALVFAVNCGRITAAEDAAISWQTFDAGTFAKAREEKKLVFLDMEAVWCHWCHVMDKTTLADQEVRESLAEDFISVKQDQDARPDLSRRYEDYGWPALVVIDPVTMQEREIASGFQTKDEFLAFLKRAKNGTPELAGDKPPKIPAENALSAKLREMLTAKLFDRYDTAQTGWGSGSKFVPWGNVEWCLRHSQKGDARASKMALETLTAGTKLIDPVWGGAYQYSTDGDWLHPHFEKIMEFQAGISSAYAMAYLVCGRQEDLKAAEEIARFLHDFLRSPEGAYYVSQDADVLQGEHSAEYFTKNDVERRAIGVPRVDKHVYSRENGMAICALVALYQASGKTEYLADAENAARWIVANRALEGGGYSHDKSDKHGPFLADQIYPGQAFLALYQATADKKWLDLSLAAADFCAGKFRRPSDEGGGYFSGVVHPDTLPPVVDRDENIVLVRWLNLLAKMSHEIRLSVFVDQGLRYICTDKIAIGIYSFTGLLLLADEECAEQPVHISVVGNRDDPAAAALFNAAQKYPSSYKFIEWVKPGEPGSIFPASDRPAAYFCTARSCSLPKFSASDLVASFAGKQPDTPH